MVALGMSCRMGALRGRRAFTPFQLVVLEQTRRSSRWSGWEIARLAALAARDGRLGFVIRLAFAFGGALVPLLLALG